MTVQPWEVENTRVGVGQKGLLSIKNLPVCDKNNYKNMCTEKYAHNGKRNIIIYWLIVHGKNAICSYTKMALNYYSLLIMDKKMTQ
jgi:hypothetical protein